MSYETILIEARGETGGILWLTLKLEWQKGVDALNQHISRNKQTLISDVNYCGIVSYAG